jgi:hypothetical protein
MQELLLRSGDSKLLMTHKKGKATSVRFIYLNYTLGNKGIYNLHNHFPIILNTAQAGLLSILK